MENIEVMVILFIIVVLGYTLCKLGYMGDRFDQKLSSIVIDLTCPALILSSVMGNELPDRTLILPLLGVGFLTYILLLIYGFWMPRLVSKNRDEQGMIGFALMFANVGFIGYPIVSSIFGPKSIFYAALLNMPNTFFIFTAGVMLVKGEYSIKSLNPKVLFSPAMIAAFIAALIVAFGIHTPDIIARPVTMVGNITVPAALMIIGSSMARLPLRGTRGRTARAPARVRHRHLSGGSDHIRHGDQLPRLRPVGLYLLPAVPDERNDARQEQAAPHLQRPVRLAGQ